MRSVQRTRNAHEQGKGARTEQVAQRFVHTQCGLGKGGGPLAHRLLGGTRVYDVTSGFRAADKKMIAYYADNYAQDYPEPEAILSATLAGATIKEAAVQMRERQSGESSINSLKSIYYMIKVSIALITYRITHRRKKL